jgi:hypothetical protein
LLYIVGRLCVCSFASAGVRCRRSKFPFCGSKWWNMVRLLRFFVDNCCVVMLVLFSISTAFFRAFFWHWVVRSFLEFFEAH